MDYYLSGGSHLSGPDSLSLQEMLDMDIKSENDLESIFSCGDLNLNFTELPALNLDEDSLGAPGDNNVWLTSSSDSHSLLGGELNSSLNLDLSSGETRMVCPNAVIPVTLIQIPYEPPEEPAESKPSGLLGQGQGGVGGRAAERQGTKRSVAAKNGPLGHSALTGRRIKTEDKEAEEEEDDSEFNEADYLKDGISFNSELDIKQEYVTESDEEETFQEAYARAVAIKSNQNWNKGKVRISAASQPASRAAGAVAVRTPVSTKRPVAAVRSVHRSINSKKRLHELNSSDSELMGSVYPKPAYSYSCLIAMALKNSPSGSLPVSEIYNFMCEHFPYFKTAPSGWKNSVRHNLSLNKCFEKIEKPATNGSQRKGCLWAMNPNKIGKMDEEVQKWSKKDKLAIKKSMVFPESLDALERGELSGNYNHNPGSIETIHSEMESEEESWDQTRQNGWTYKNETDDEEEEVEEEEEEEAEKPWVTARDSGKTVVCGLGDTELDDSSDISLTDFDIEVAESIYKDVDTTEKLKIRLNGQSPNGLEPLAGIGLSGGANYTIKSQAMTAMAQDSSKRFKALGGNTISGNYVYKPLGTSSSRRKSPLRPTLITSLEAED